MDVRLFSRAMKLGAIYTRYADDITFSFGDREGQMRVIDRKTQEASMEVITPVRRRITVSRLVSTARHVAKSHGYKLHSRKKFTVLTQHDRMQVTGIVVNERLNLPRALRRKMRAVEHHLDTGRPATMTAAQLEGWKAFAAMVKAGGESG
jgi:hypothetical protein